MVDRATNKFRRVEFTHRVILFVPVVYGRILGLLLHTLQVSAQLGPEGIKATATLGLIVGGSSG